MTTTTSPAFRFCLNLLTELPIPQLLELWARCEAAGIDYVGVADSPMLLNDAIVTATAAVSHLQRARAMFAVTNPVSRDPSVLAGALHTLQCLAPGRIECGIGSGDSAMWTVGLKPATVARVEEYVTAVKALLRGEEASYDGRRFRAQWKQPTPPPEVPIHVACAGPKLLRAACRFADGVILAMGFSDDDLELVRRTIEAGCAEAGRDPATLEVWWQTTITFAPTVEEAMERSIGINTSWMKVGGLAGKQIPAELVEPLLKFNVDMEDVASTYVATDRGAVLVQRAKALGLYDWLVARAPGFFGPPENIAARLEQFAQRGMTNWMFYVAPIHGDRSEYLDRFADGVLPLLRSGASTPPAGSR